MHNEFVDAIGKNKKIYKNVLIKKKLRYFIFHENILFLLLSLVFSQRKKNPLKQRMNKPRNTRQNAIY